jgi:gas vesicle protein
MQTGTMFELNEDIVLLTKFIIMTTTTKVILGLIGAAAVGAAVGLLLAPEKGSDLRKNIADRAGKLSDKLSETFRNSRDGVKRAVSQAQSEM